MTLAIRVAARWLTAQRPFQLSDWNLEGLAEGKATTLYHGTNRSFKAFDIDKSRKDLVNRFYGSGIFLTPSKQVADRYANANRNIGFDPEIIDDLKARNTKAGAFLNLLYRKGNDAWDMLDRDFFKLGPDDDYLETLTDYIGGVDANTVADVARWVIGTKLRNEQPDDLDIQDVFDAFAGGSAGTGMPSWAYDNLDEIGLDSSKYRPKVYTVQVSVRNVLVTANKSQARSAKSKGYDCVVYHGSGLVAGVPEVAVFNPRDVKITHTEVVS
jgi:hypothetical protein